MPISIDELYKIYKEHLVLTTDSRNVPEGSIFFGLKGDNFDGNRFAPDAITKGAAYAVVDDPGAAQGNQYILVDDVLATLQSLAKYHREHLKIPVLAITGSNGKTTTKEFINAVLSKKYKTFATEGNLNNHIGVPLTILSITNSTELAVIEMGANHIGEINELCQIAQPVYGLITNIGKAHLGGFGGIEGVIRAKQDLYNYIRFNGGEVFVNADNPLLMELSHGMQKILFGTGHDVYCRGYLLNANPLVEFVFEGTEGREINVSTKIIGKYNFENLLAAVCVGRYFGVDDQAIKKALESYQMVSNRSQVVHTSRNMVILDAYNANPTSMAAALESFDVVNGRHKVAIIGDMLETGDAEAGEHQHILEQLALRDLKAVILVGPVFSKINTNQKFRTFNDSVSALEWLKQTPIHDAAVLIKGSRKIKLETLLEAL